MSNSTRTGALLEQLGGVSDFSSKERVKFSEQFVTASSGDLEVAELDKAIEARLCEMDMAQGSLTKEQAGEKALEDVVAAVERMVKKSKADTKKHSTLDDKIAQQRITKALQGIEHHLKLNHFDLLDKISEDAATGGEPEAPYRAIFTTEGKKVDLVRGATLQLAWVDEEGSITTMAPKEFIKSKLPRKEQPSVEGELIRALLKPLPFGKQVDFNSWTKRAGASASFEERLEKVMSMGASLTKRGIKVQ